MSVLCWYILDDVNHIQGNDWIPSSLHLFPVLIQKTYRIQSSIKVAYIVICDEEFMVNCKNKNKNKNKNKSTLRSACKRCPCNGPCGCIIRHQRPCQSSSEPRTTEEEEVYGRMPAATSFFLSVRDLGRRPFGLRGYKSTQAIGHRYLVKR